MSKQFHVILLTGLVLVFPHASLLGANLDDAPVSELQMRFLRLEQRALDLSRKLADSAGVEPIELIDRNESLEPVPIESEAQQSYDALPGPMVEPLPLPEAKEREQEAQPVVFQSEVQRVVPTTQQRKGDYYLMPVVGLAMATQTTFSENALDDELDGKWGNSIGLSAGRRWDNWMAYARVAYQYLEYENLNFRGQSLQTRVEGTEESYSLGLGGGYTISLTEGLSTYGTAGLGMAWRRNSADVSVYIDPFQGQPGYWRPDPNSLSPSYSSLVFTYDFSMGLEYMFANNYSMLLGYRLLGLTSNKSFEGSFQHLIELGVGANF